MIDENTLIDSREKLNKIAEKIAPLEHRDLYSFARPLTVSELAKNHLDYSKKYKFHVSSYTLEDAQNEIIAILKYL